MRKATSAAAAVVVGAAGLGGPAAAATPAPIIQAFRITVTSQLVRVSAHGAAVRGQGTAIPVTATSYTLRFPGGPGWLRESVTRSVRTVGPGCVERLAQIGTFTFQFSPAARPGFRFGGRGGFSSSRLTVLRRRPGGGCLAGRRGPVGRLTVEAGATQVFVIG